MSLLGILGGIGQAFLGELTGAPEAPPSPGLVGTQDLGMLVPGGNGQVTAPGGGQITPAAIPVINLLMDGASDAMVRTAASRARVSKAMLFDTLQGLDIVGGAGTRAFTPLEKIAISDQIERIFKPRRRGPISKGLRRTIKQIKFLRKELKPLFPSKR